MPRVLRLSRRSIKSSVFLFAFATAAHAQPVLEQLTGKVVGVSDGDTLTVFVQRDQSLEQIKVRVSGIDAPEKAQPFGNRAKQGLSDCAFAYVVDLRSCERGSKFVRAECGAK